MFLRRYTRKKSGKTHSYYALVESVRTEAGTRQRTVAHLGELSSGDERRWRRTAIFYNRQGEAEQLRLFANEEHVALPDDPDVVCVRLGSAGWSNGRNFGDVWLGGVDAAPHVKADFEARRVRASKLLRLDALDLRHRMPHEWYVWAYTRLLPLAYKVVARQDSGGATGITADDWFVTDEVDETTLVLFAVARAPRRADDATSRAPRRPARRNESA